MTTLKNIYMQMNYSCKEKKNSGKTNKKIEKKMNFSFYLLLEIIILTPWHLKKIIQVC